MATNVTAEGDGHSSKTQTVAGNDDPSILSQNVQVVDHRQCNMLFREFVSRKAAGKGRAILEGVGLLSEVIDMCYQDNPHQEEEAVQSGLLKWRNGGGNPPTWALLLEAMTYARIGIQHVRSLEKELLKVEVEGGCRGLTGGVKEKYLYDSPLAQKYLEHVRDTYNEMSVSGDYPHVDYIGLRVIESHPNQHKNEDTAQFLRNFQKATVDFISQQAGDMSEMESESDGDLSEMESESDGDMSEMESESDGDTSEMESGSDTNDDGHHTTGLLSHDHFLQQHKKPLHIVFGPPGVGKTSFSCHICSKFSSAPQSSSHSLILLFYVREKKVAEAKSLRDLLSCYSLPGDDSGYDVLAQLITKNKGKGLQIIFDGLDERPEVLVDETSIVTKLLKGKLKEAQILVTSRPGIVTKLSKQWHRASLYEVQGFGSKEVLQYVESYFHHEGDPSAAPRFLSALADRPDLAGSTYIPLNLWLLCSVFSLKDCNLPDTLTQCYTTLFSQVLQRQAEKQELDISITHTLEDLPDDIQTTLDCLSQLSYLCYLKEELVFDEEIVVKTCLFSNAKLKHRFDGMSLLNVHPKKHGAMDHLTFNFLHSTYQEYLCARHILTSMSEEEQAAFWKTYINNPRFAMVFRFYCGLSQLHVKGVQEIVKGQELPSRCDNHDRRLLFLFYALHESGNTQLTTAIASQLDSSLEFWLLMSSYDCYVTGQCLSKTAHLRRMDFGRNIYTQETKYAIPCVVSVASLNHLVSVRVGLTEFTLSDAQKLTSVLRAVVDLHLTLAASSGDAVEELLFIPTLKQLKLDVRSFNDCQTGLHPKSKSSVRKLYLSFPSEGAACLGRMMNNCSLIEELVVQCNSEDAGDIIAPHLPEWKNLRRVTFADMNPVPILLSVGSCGHLDEVVIYDPEHFKVPAHDGSDLGAGRLRRLELYCGSGGDSEVLRTCLSIVTRYTSLQELQVRCYTPDAGDIIAPHLPEWKNLRKVTFDHMNPVPILLSVGSCGYLDEVVIKYPKHFKVPAHDGSDLGAGRLRRLELYCGSGGDSEVLRTCLSIVTRYTSLQELQVRCYTPDAGDIIAPHLPEWKNLRKVTFDHMNPVPILLSVGSCGYLDEVVIKYPKHFKVPAHDGSDLSSAHLRRLDLNWGVGGDNEVLRACLSIVSRYSSLEELKVGCSTPDAGDIIATTLPTWKGLRKVDVDGLNPIPLLQVVGQCYSLEEVVINYPHHCEPTTEDWSKVSSSLATAQQFKKVELWLGDDVTFLEACLPSLSHSPSLQELRVWCSSSSAGQVLADNVLPLQSVEKLSIRDINPVPVLRVLSQNAEHCSVSTLGIALDRHPELLIGVSDLLGQCKSIRALELYLSKGPEAIIALNSCLEGVCHSSVTHLSLTCLDAAAGPVVAQLVPHVVGCMAKLSVSLPDPTNVVEALQDRSVAHFTLDMTHSRGMTQHDLLRLKDLLSGLKSRKVSIVFQHEWQFPYRPWVIPNISPSQEDILCVCTGVSTNPHLRDTEVYGVPPGLLTEAQCLLLRNPSCDAITLNGEALHQVGSSTSPTHLRPVGSENRQLRAILPTLIAPFWGFPSRRQRGLPGCVLACKSSEEVQDMSTYELDVD